jgi:hypothetical protein
MSKQKNEKYIVTDPKTGKKRVAIGKPSSKTVTDSSGNKHSKSNATKPA